MSRPPTQAIVGVDFTPGSDVAIVEALTRQQRGHVGIVRLAHVMPWKEGYVRRAGAGDGDAMAHAAARLNAHVVELIESVTRAGPSIDVWLHIALGHVGTQLLQLAVDYRAQLIILGPHRGPRLDPRVIGRTAKWVLEHSHCPVLVARRMRRPFLEPIPKLVATCAECIRSREASAGAEHWCQAHAQTYAPTRSHVQRARTELSDKAQDARARRD